MRCHVRYLWCYYHHLWNLSFSYWTLWNSGQKLLIWSQENNIYLERQGQILKMWRFIRGFCQKNLPPLPPNDNLPPNLYRLTKHIPNQIRNPILPEFGISNWKTESKVSIPICFNCECLIIPHLAKENTYYLSQESSSLTKSENKEARWYEVLRHIWKKGRMRKDVKNKGICRLRTCNTNTFGHNLQGVLPFAYIGVSNLAVLLGSYRFTKQYHSYQSFYPRGTHGKSC